MQYKLPSLQPFPIYHHHLAYLFSLTMITMTNIFRNKPAVQPNRQQQQGPDVKSENIFLTMMKVLLFKIWDYDDSFSRIPS